MMNLIHVMHDSQDDGSQNDGSQDNDTQRT